MSLADLGIGAGYENACFMTIVQPILVAINHTAS